MLANLTKVFSPIEQEVMCGFHGLDGPAEHKLVCSGNSCRMPPCWEMWSARRTMTTYRIHTSSGSPLHWQEHQAQGQDIYLRFFTYQNYCRYWRYLPRDPSICRKWTHDLNKKGYEIVSADVLKMGVSSSQSLKSWTHKKNNNYFCQCAFLPLTCNQAVPMLKMKSKKKSQSLIRKWKLCLKTILVPKAWRIEQM